MSLLLLLLLWLLLWNVDIVEAEQAMQFGRHGDDDDEVDDDDDISAFAANYSITNSSGTQR